MRLSPASQRMHGDRRLAGPIRNHGAPTALAENLLAMSQEEFSAAFRKSPMKRAKLAGLQRNARVVLGKPSAP